MSALPATFDTALTGTDGDTEAYHTLARLLDDGPLRLVDAEGDAAPVPPELHATLRSLVALLTTKQGALIVPVGLDLGTQQAADLLGVSRPMLIQWLDEGKMPFTHVHRLRRIRLTDVLAYREVFQAERRRALTALIRMSEEMGEYDVTPEELAAFEERMKHVTDDDIWGDYVE